MHSLDTGSTQREMAEATFLGAQGSGAPSAMVDRSLWCSLLILAEVCG